MYPLIVALPLMVCLVWTAILLMDFRRADLPRRALAHFGFVSTVLYFCHYLYYTQQPYSLGVECVFIFCTLAVYPMYYFFVRCLIKIPRRPDLFGLWLLPAICFTGWALVAGLCGGNRELVRNCTILAIPVVSIATMVSVNIDLHYFRRRVKNYYADVEGKTLDPIPFVMVLLLIMALSTSWGTLWGRILLIGKPLMLIPALLHSITFFFLFYIGQHLSSPDEATQKPVGLPSAPAIPEDQQATLMERIEEQMQEHQLFLKKGLLISDLAEAVGSNRTYVSNCINQQTGMTFSDYVNSKRVAYAQELIAGQEKLPLAEIAEKAGYSDRSSFYRAFKKVTGQSPSDYIKERD